jgi:hypothetical protein
MFKILAFLLLRVLRGFVVKLKLIHLHQAIGKFVSQAVTVRCHGFLALGLKFQDFQDRSAAAAYLQALFITG